MRTFTTTHTVYSFDELDDTAKAKAIEKQREFEQEFSNDWLPDAMADKLAELLEANGLKCDDAKIYYSLGYSQGDGAMFEGTVSWHKYRVDIRQNGHYYHYNSKHFDVTDEDTGDYADNNIEMEFNDIYTDICKDLERYGYDCLEQAESDETIIDSINANEYEFYSDGSMA
jgi:hypothetical protein